VIQTIFVTPRAPVPGWPTLSRLTRERTTLGSYQRAVLGQRRADATLQITLTGRGRCRMGDGPWRAVPRGSALLFDAGLDHGLVYEVDPDAAGWDFLYLNCDGPAALAKVRGLIAGGGHVHPCPPNHPLLRRWLALLPPTGAVHRVMGTAEIAQTVDGFLHLLATARADGAGDLVDCALALITDSWRAPPDASSLARQLGVSREHLVRRFRAATGEPPAAWARRHRIERAADLLVADERPLAAIAADAGFATASHFVRSFRVVMGETPAGYRRRRRPAPRSRTPVRG